MTLKSRAICRLTRPPLVVMYGRTIPPTLRPQAPTSGPIPGSSQGTEFGSVAWAIESDQGARRRRYRYRRQRATQSWFNRTATRRAGADNDRLLRSSSSPMRRGIAIVTAPCIQSSCAPGGTGFSPRTGPNVPVPWLVCDQQSCPLPPGTEIRNCIPLIKLSVLAAPQAERMGKDGTRSGLDTDCHFRFYRNSEYPDGTCFRVTVLRFIFNFLINHNLQNIHFIEENKDMILLDCPNIRAYAYEKLTKGVCSDCFFTHNSKSAN